MINQFTLLICFFSVLVALSYKPLILNKEFDVQKLEGYVVSEQSFSEKTSSFVFETVNKEKILVRTEKYFNYSYGDKISILGNLKIPENFENQNGLIFDYQNFLLKDGITHTIYFPEVEILEENSKKDLFWAIFWFKENLVLQVKRVFDSNTSSLVLGILLGFKDSINSDLEENFRRTGLIHILVLSGFNLTIIAYFVFKILSKVHRNIRYTLSLFLIFLFVIMVGAGATVVRAAIMISIFIFSKLMRRNSNPNNALLIAASCMVLNNPMILLYDPSFQLSFVATIGLINFYPIIENIFSFISEKVALREIIVSNISVQIFVIPLLAYMMGEFSIIALIPNILILPFIPIFMFVSFFAITVSFLGIGLHLPLVLLIEFLAKFMSTIVNLFGNLNFATLNLVLDIKYLVIIYLFFIFVIFFIQIKENVISKRRYSYLL